MGKTTVRVCLVGWLCGLSVAGGAPDLDEYARRLTDAALAFELAVDAADLELPLEYGSLGLEHGVLVPVHIPDDDRSFEWVFVGRGRLRVDPPDEVEAQQLISFTGNDTFDASIQRAVLIIGDVTLATRLRDKPAVEIDSDTRSIATRLFGEWTVDAEREGFGARQALLRAMTGDVSGTEFFAVWFESNGLGRGYYHVDPSSSEPVSLGAYQLLDRKDLLTHRAKKRAERVEAWKKKKEQQAGRSDPSGESDTTCGAGIDDAREQSLKDSRERTLEWIEPWISSVRPGANPDAGAAAVEPEHYQIEIDLSGDALEAKGSARIRLRSERDGTRVVSLGLGRALETCEVFRDETPLPFHRIDSEVLVLLPEPTVAGERFELTVHFAGKPIDHWLARRRLRHTMWWYPHAGGIDRATYDVTLRWPEQLTLLAGGDRVEHGSKDGVRWERRVLDVPAMGFSFEIGDYDAIDQRVGHIDLTFGFHRQDHELTEEIRAEIRKVVMASILYFETRFGLLPIDRLTVVTADRGFSQGLLGFVTLAEGAMHGIVPSLQDNRTSQELRLETIAHEISHQWWGNVVGWDSYRDQWLSEALADFSATRFMEEIAPHPEDYQRRHATLWRKGLKEMTLDGRSVNALGPVVLGRRLLQNHGPAAYQSIVYEKGAAVFSTLAQRLGPGPTMQMLGALARTVHNRVIGTTTFVKALERMSGQDLQGFARQYVHGTGMPAMFYDYRSSPSEQSGWLLEGHVLQLPAPQARYVVQRTGSGWDVTRQIFGETDIGDWLNVVPYRVVLDDDDPTVTGRGTQGTLEIRGERATFSLRVDRRPSDFQLDPSGQILADVQAERFEPKRHLCLVGEHLASLGRFDEAWEILDRALQAETVVREADISEHLTQQTAELDARIRLARARIMLDRGETAAARLELRAVDELLPKRSDYYEGERTALRARFELMTGEYAFARETLNDYLIKHGLVLETYRQDSLLDSSALSAIKISRGEMLALLAVAAHQSGERDAEVLVRRAGLAGVDMRALR